MGELARNGYGSINEIEQWPLQKILKYNHEFAEHCRRMNKK